MSLILLTGLPLRPCLPALCLPVTLPLQPATLCASLFVHFFSVWSQLSVTKVSFKATLAHFGRKKKKDWLICNSFYDIEWELFLFSFPTQLNMMTIPRPTKFSANRTDWPRISHVPDTHIFWPQSLGRTTSIPGVKHVIESDFACMFSTLGRKSRSRYHEMAF